MGLFSAYIWHNSSLLYHFRHLSGRNIYSAFILSEKVVFCDYMTWNAGNSIWAVRRTAMNATHIQVTSI